MAINNNYISVFKSSYDLKNRIKERDNAIKNKEIEKMSVQDFEHYLDLITNATQYVEKSNVMITNSSNNR